jgi:hypothetical protein
LDGEVVVTGYVFNDANGNQRRDSNERGLPNMTVVSQPAALIGAAVALGSLSLLSATVVAIAVRNHARVMRQIAHWQASREAESARITDSNWRRVVQQLIADSLGQVVQIESLIAISVQPVPHIRFRATNAHVYGFCLGKRLPQCPARPRHIDGMTHPSAPGELRALWLYFAVKMRMPEMLPRRDSWYVFDVSPHLSPLRRLMHGLELTWLRIIAAVRSRIERVTSRRSNVHGGAAIAMSGHRTATEPASAPMAQVEQDMAYQVGSIPLRQEEDANADEVVHQTKSEDIQPIAEREAEPNAD